MMGVAGILGGATVVYINTVIHIRPLELFHQHSQKKHTPWLYQIGFGLKFLV